MQRGLTLHWFGGRRFLRHLQQVLLRSQHRSHSEFPNWAIKQTNTHSINPVWAVNSSSWRAQSHCIAAGFFSGQGRESEVNAGEEEKADARLERRRETKAGKYRAFLYYALDAVMQLTCIALGTTQRDVAGWEQAQSTLSVRDPQHCFGQQGSLQPGNVGSGGAQSCPGWRTPGHSARGPFKQLRSGHAGCDLQLCHLAGKSSQMDWPFH